MKKGDHLLDGVKLTAKELDMLRDLEKSGERVKIVERGTDSAKTVDKVNDARKYNNAVMEEIKGRKDWYKLNENYDCSEIAEDLLNISGGKGKIYNIESKTGWVNGKEYGEIKNFQYHQVYSDGKYIYDPRFSDSPLLNEDYFKIMKELNPNGITIK